MPYVIVLVVATIAGSVVGAMTLRAGRVASGGAETWTEAYRGGSTGEVGDEAEPVRRRLPPDPNAQTRAIGAAGLAGVVLVGAGTIALLGYVLWTLLKGVFS